MLKIINNVCQDKINFSTSNLFCSLCPNYLNTWLRTAI